MWEIEGTDTFKDWFLAVDAVDTAAVNKAVDQLEEHGPALRRPLVGHIVQSRHPNMRELIVAASNIRILFAFDPRRTAILLLGGSKTGKWDAWYDENVPLADNLYDEYLAELRKEGTV
jgi:hypothetical protein